MAGEIRFLDMWPHLACEFDRAAYPLTTHALKEKRFSRRRQDPSSDVCVVFLLDLFSHSSRLYSGSKSVNLTGLKILNRSDPALTLSSLSESVALIWARLPLYVSARRAQLDRVGALPSREAHEGILINEQLIHIGVKDG